jgi:hypothetical protein
MRSYVIRGTEVEVCRKRPNQLEEGDLVVTSSEELHDARLLGKQLLAILNALSGKKLTKLGDRKKALDRLWTMLRELPAPAPAKAKKASTGPSKQAQVIAMLRRPEGATVDAIVAATGWQKHTVRGAISGALKKKLGLTVLSEKGANGARVYRIADAG